MEQAPIRRRRPALSCITCRERKVKCDRNEPCSRCVTSGLSCSYRTRVARPSVRRLSRHNSPQRPPSPHHVISSPTLLPTRSLSVSSASEPLPRARHPLPWAAAATAAAREGNEPSDLLGHGHVGTNNPFINKLSDSSGFQTRARIFDSSDVAADVANSAPVQDGRHAAAAHRLGPQGPRIILNKTRMLRWSHWIGTAKEFGTVVECYMKFVTANTETDGAFQDPESRALAVRIGELIRDCKTQARRTKISRPTRHLPSYQFDLLAPSRDVSDLMVDNYFRCFESTHRILHVPSFRTAYEDFWTQPDQVNASLRLIVLLVIAIGSSLDERAVADAGFRSTIWNWVYAAQTWLAGPLEKDRLDIAGLQVHCLTLLAREIFSIGRDLVWISTGSLIHSAMQMGLHRDPKHFPDMSIFHAEIRRRLWATILEMTLQSSLDSALPTGISLEDFDAEPPSNIDDGEISESTDTIQAQPRDAFTSTSIQLLLFDSFPIRLRIVQLLNNLHSEIMYTDVLNLDSEVIKALKACNEFASSSEGLNMTSFHRNLLDYLIRRFLVPLHCPFASQARENHLFNYSLETSLNASLALISPEPDEGFSRLMTIGGGLFREGVRCASSIICLELLARVEAQRLDGTVYRNSRQTQVFKQAISDMIFSSSERIRLGETNIKAHLFLNMVLAQIEAIQKCKPCELEIAKSAEKSLQFCHDMISERAVNAPSSRPANGGFTPLSFDQGQDILGLNLNLDPGLGFDLTLANDTFY